MDDKYKKLEAEVEGLKRQVAALSNVTQLPVEIERTFRSRLNAITGQGNNLGTYAEANIRRTISLSGDPQSIEVLEYPTTYIPVLFQGHSYNIPIISNS